MTRRYGRALGGARCRDAAGGHWQTLTFIAGLRADGLTAPWCLDQAMTGETFKEYLRSQLGPTLKPGDIVICDNLSAHKVAGVQAIIAAHGATIQYLPPYSPDLNPIEQVFAKLKALCARPQSALTISFGVPLVNCWMSFRLMSASISSGIQAMFYVIDKCSSRQGQI